MTGVLTVRFKLTDDLADLDYAWVTDPVWPARRMRGRWDHVLYDRQVATGQVEGDYM